VVACFRIVLVDVVATGVPPAESCAAMQGSRFFQRGSDSEDDSEDETSSEEESDVSDSDSSSSSDAEGAKCASARAGDRLTSRLTLQPCGSSPHRMCAGASLLDRTPRTRTTTSALSDQRGTSAMMS
jgi:hypothetical protein